MMLAVPRFPLSSQRESKTEVDWSSEEDDEAVVGLSHLQSFISLGINTSRPSQEKIRAACVRDRPSSQAKK
jgi:hypothetical protein